MYQISMRIIIYNGYEVFIIHKQFEFLWISSNVLVLIENYLKLHNLCINMQFWAAFLHAELESWFAKCGFNFALFVQQHSVFMHFECSNS